MAKTATAKKQKTFSIDDVLATATVKKEAKSKSKVPILTVSDDVKKLATKIREVKAKLDSTETQYKTLQAEIIEEVSPLRTELCRRGYQSSVRIPDTNGLSIGLSWSHSYSKIGAESADTIKEIIGDDRYEEYFKIDLNITVKDVSDENLKELIEVVGPERFAQFFDVERNIKPLDRYTDEFFMVFTPEQQESLSQFVRQFKPSIKTK